MDLTKESLKYLAEQGINPKERVVSINNQSYVIDENGNPIYVEPKLHLAESKFIFRMQDGPKGAIFEADGGAWRNQAILNIKKYLGNQLSDEIKKGKITILA